MRNDDQLSACVVCLLAVLASYHSLRPASESFSSSLFSMMFFLKVESFIIHFIRCSLIPWDEN